MSKGIIAISLILLLCIKPSFASESTEGEVTHCVEFKDIYDIRQLSKYANILIKVDSDQSTHYEKYSENKKDPFDELCDLFSAMSEERRDGMAIGTVVVSEPGYDSNGILKETNKDVARELHAGDASKWPQLVLVKKRDEANGVDDDDKTSFSKSITLYDQDDLELNDKDDDGTMKPEHIVEFVRKNTGFRIGSFVYNIPIFDQLATRFMSVPPPSKGEESTISQQIQIYSFAYIAKTISFIHTHFISKKEGGDPVVKMYVKCFFKVLEVGPSYPAGQMKRIETKLNDNSDASNKDVVLTMTQVEYFHQKHFVLNRFVDLVEVTKEDDWNFYISIASHIGMVVALVLLVITLLWKEEENDAEQKENDGDDEEEEEEEEEDKTDGEKNGIGQEETTNGTDGSENNDESIDPDQKKNQ